MSESVALYAVAGVECQCLWFILPLEDLGMFLVRAAARGPRECTGNWPCPSLVGALESCPDRSQLAALRRVVPAHHLNSTVELALEAWVQVSWAAGRKAGELSLPPAYSDIRWPSRRSAGEFILMVWVRESQFTGQLNHHPGPDPGL